MTRLDAQAASAELLSPAEPARLFVIGGLMLVIAGMIFGDVYAVFIMHPNNGHIGRELGAAVYAAAAGDADSVVSHFGLIGSLLENAGTKKDAHVHLLHAGYLAFLLAFLQPWVAWQPGRKWRLARTFLMASVVLPVSIFLIHYVGLVYSPLQTIGWASIFADLAGLVLILVLVAELAGMWRYARGHGSAPGGWQRPIGENARTLLAGGTILLLVGFLFGAYYAGAHLDEHASRELGILGDLLAQAAASNSGALDQGLAAYGGLQVERGVMIAAHAHVIEFGLLAVLMAIVQPYVYLSAAWRRRLVWLLLGGGALLPAAVYAEIWYGLLTGAVADLGGLMVIIAVFGMLIGVLRYGGKIDGAQEQVS
jgi:hypothetical protein